jgi:hypothetical protein
MWLLPTIVKLRSPEFASNAFTWAKPPLAPAWVHIEFVTELPSLMVTSPPFM